MNLTFETEHRAVIWNSELIGRYKEMSPGESYSQLDLIWNSQIIGRYKEMSPGECESLHLRKSTT